MMIKIELLMIKKKPKPTNKTWTKGLARTVKKAENKFLTNYH